MGRGSGSICSCGKDKLSYWVVYIGEGKRGWRGGSRFPGV